jgi:hypothetical protein
MIFWTSRCCLISANYKLLALALCLISLKMSMTHLLQNAEQMMLLKGGLEVP